jgi:hypothetical protein
MAVMFGQGVAFAQEGGQTEDTHAHSESHKWKGIDVETVLNKNNPEYKPEYATKGRKIYLFNVGTGRFIIEGGNWGMEGRLFHEDFGRPMYLKNNHLIDSGITEKNSDKSVFGCNASGPFHNNPWSSWEESSFTLMMDANKNFRKGWFFERVEDENNTDTYTYYMYETSKKDGYTDNNKYYLGAAWGECWAVDSNGNPAWKGNGTLVFMDDDRASWTSIDPKGVTDKYLVNGEMITLDELYQWRVVSEEQFYAVLSEEVTGLNPSIAALIPDRDFTRNANDFDTNWVMEEKPDGDYSETGRYGYTFGVYLNKQTQQQYNKEQNGKDNKFFDNEAWNKPIRLKNVFEGTAKYGWTNARYGFLSFEGVGRTYTEFEVPQPGWYMVQCYGFIQNASNSNNDAYLFAKVKDSSTNSIEGGESRNNLVKVSANKFGSKDKQANCLEVGKALTRPDRDKESYKNTVWILVTEEQFNNGQKTLQVGVGKDAATRSSNSKIDSETGAECYYDTDWVCVDDFRASYLGLGPCFFYEDEENLDYLLFDEEHIKKQHQSAVPNGHYSGATCLERTFKKNQWNSFSFPLPLTGEQVRYAFGEDAALAKIHSVGKMSKNPNVIDFKTVPLFTTEVVVEPGHFYLLKPTKEPTKGIDPLERNTTYYELGRMFFSVNENESAEYTHDKMSVNEVIKTDKQAIESLQNLHDGFAGVNYVQTPNYSGFSVSDGIYTGTPDHGIYAPKGSYVVSNNTILHLAKDTRIKGFRGWIKLNNPIDSQSKEFTMEIFGMFDEEPEQGGTTSVPRIHLFTSNESVYDLYGRKVGKLGDTLPKGIYIVKGKKYMVK